MKTTYKWGLKIWSTNEQYRDEAWRLYDEGLYSYIELFSVPDSFERCIALWNTLPIPFVIHAPHYSVGLNFAKKDQEKKNKLLAHEAFRYADALKTSFVIFHPGVEGDLSETIRQIKALYDNRVLIENKPYYGFDDYTTMKNRLVCRGASPEEIQEILHQTSVGFCLDISHALYAANSLERNQYETLEAFLSFGPAMFHISDGEQKGHYDLHKVVGQGDFDLKKILSFISHNSCISIESHKLSKTSLESCRQEVIDLEGMLA